MNEASSQRRGRWLPGVSVALGGLLLSFRALLTNETGRVLWADDLDPRLVRWIVEWGHHALVTEPARFWHANAWYPEAYATAFTDSMVGLQVFYTPLRSLGAEPLVALYLGLAAYALIGVLFSQHALLRLGGLSAVEQATVLFAAHFSLCMVAFWGHYQLFGFHLAPAFFIYLYLYLRRYELGDLVLLCTVFCGGAMMSIYFGPLILAVSVVLAPALLVSRWRESGTEGWIRRVGWRAPIVVALFAVGLYQVLVRPHLRISNRFDGWSLDRLDPYAADPTSLVASPTRHSLWYAPETSPVGYHETAYFPGYLLLAGLAIALLVQVASAVRRRRRRADRPIEDPPSTLWLFATLLFVVPWTLSWGPGWQTEAPGVPTPFTLLREVVPGLEGVRAPGRFGMLLGLPLGLMLVRAVRSVARGARGRALLGAVVLAALVAESATSFETYSYRPDPRGVYRRVAEQLRPDTPLIELPLARPSHLAYLHTIVEQLNGSTLHWGRLLVGYGAYRTPQLDELTRLDRAFQEGRAEPSDLIGFARRQGARYLLVHLGRYRTELRQEWIGAVGGPGVLLRHRRSILVDLEIRESGS